MPFRWIDVLYYARYGNPEPYRRLEKTEEEWKLLLSTPAYNIMRGKGTEPAFRNAFCRTFEPGLYVCKGCRSPLFSSEEKSHKLSGWPSFRLPIAKGSTKYSFDNSHGMSRIEVACNVCDGHLGHVFPDGPQPAGLRYCINSESMERVDEEALQQKLVNTAG